MTGSKYLYDSIVDYGEAIYKRLGLPVPVNGPGYRVELVTESGLSVLTSSQLPDEQACYYCVEAIRAAAHDRRNYTLYYTEELKWGFKLLCPNSKSVLATATVECISEAACKGFVHTAIANAATGTVERRGRPFAV